MLPRSEAHCLQRTKVSYCAEAKQRWLCQKLLTQTGQAETSRKGPFPEWLGLLRAGYLLDHSFKEAQGNLFPPGQKHLTPEDLMAELATHSQHRSSLSPTPADQLSPSWDTPPPLRLLALPPECWTYKSVPPAQFVQC